MALDLDDVVVARPTRRKPPPSVSLADGCTIDSTDGGGAASPAKPKKITDTLHGLPRIVVSAINGVATPPNSKITPERWVEVKEAFARLNRVDDLPLLKRILAVKLTAGQKKAFYAMVDFALASDQNRFFALKGWAGTGKSYVLRRVALLCDLLGVPWLLTAPTNQATKVLTLSIPGIKRENCKTIYSALKLSMSTDEDQQVLVDLSADQYSDLGFTRGTLICIDEASMLNQQVVTKVAAVAKDLGLRILFIGDPDQLRPVKEERSTSWDLCGVATSIDGSHETLVRTAFLSEVKRFDSALLDLSVKLRAAVGSGKLPSLDTLFPNVKGEIVRCRTSEEFEDSILRITHEDFIDSTRVIAWRNRTVERYNGIIRKNLGFLDEFNVGDLLMLAQPKLQKVNYRRSIIIANIDEAVIVTAIRARTFKAVSTYFPNCPVIDHWELTVQTVDFQDKPFVMTLWVPTQDDIGLEDTLQSMAAGAKRAGELAYRDKPNQRRLLEERRNRWKEYWALREEFTLVRFGYAITAHRSQGSSLRKTYVDVRDVLANPEVVERHQCLYVIGTRARETITVLA